MAGDDADFIAEIQKGLDEVWKAKTRYENVLHHNEKRSAAKTVRKMLSNSDWNAVYEQRDEILELTKKSGKLSSRELLSFQSDPGAWAKELNEVWEEQQRRLKSEL